MYFVSTAFYIRYLGAFRCQGLLFHFFKLLFRVLYLKKGLSCIARLLSPAATRRSSLSCQIFFVFQGIHYLNKRTLSRAKINFAISVPFSKSTCFGSRLNVFRTSRSFVGFRWLHKPVKVWNLWLNKRIWVPVYFKTSWEHLNSTGGRFGLANDEASNEFNSLTQVINYIDCYIITGTSWRTQLLRRKPFKVYQHFNKPQTLLFLILERGLGRVFNLKVRWPFWNKRVTMTCVAQMP